MMRKIIYDTSGSQGILETWKGNFYRTDHSRGIVNKEITHEIAPKRNTIVRNIPAKKLSVKRVDLSDHPNINPTQIEDLINYNC